MTQFKQKCVRCKINYVVTSSRGNHFPVCFECEKGQMQGEITDPKIKELLNIPEEFYKESSFLRSIKINALKYGQLSERQIDTFKSVVDKLNSKPKEKKSSEKKEITLADIPMPTEQVSMRAMRLAKKAKKKSKE